MALPLKGAACIPDKQCKLGTKVTRQTHKTTRSVCQMSITPTASRIVVASAIRRQSRRDYVARRAQNERVASWGMKAISAPLTYDDMSTPGGNGFPCFFISPSKYISRRPWSHNRRLLIPGTVMVVMQLGRSSAEKSRSNCWFKRSTSCFQW